MTPNEKKKSPLGASTHEILLETLPFLLGPGGCRPDARARMMELAGESVDTAAVLVLAWASRVGGSTAPVETTDGASAQSGGQATGGVQPADTPIGAAQRVDAARRKTSHLREVRS